MKAFRSMGRTFRATYDELFLCVAVSVLWWLGTLLVVTAAPATVGLHRVTNRIANYQRVETAHFWEGARQHVGRGWLLYALSVLVPLGIAFNIWFYWGATSWIRVLTFFWLWVILFFLMAAQYFFPLFWQQDEPGLRLILRNASLLALRHPLYTVLMLLFVTVLVAVSGVLAVPVLLLLPAMVALAANFALTGLLQEMGLAPEPPAPPHK